MSTPGTLETFGSWKALGLSCRIGKIEDAMFNFVPTEGLKPKE